MRLAPVTASARSVPLLTCGIAGGSAMKAIGVWLPSAEAIAGPAPPKGTLTMSSLNVSRNNSPERCGVVPVPGWA